MSGAAFLCGKAAYSTGVGLVKIYTHESNRTILQSQLPEAIMMTYSDYEGALACIEDSMKWATVIVVGPGLGVDSTSERMLYELLINTDVPLVIDADALNILSNNMELLETSSAEMIMTPHMKEMSRLIQKEVPAIAKDRFDIAMKFAKKMGVTLVLKDAKSIVTNGGEQMFMSLAGNNGMSTGGSGDVLAGIMVSLLGQGVAPIESAAAAAWLHGKAGDICAKEIGQYGMLPGDMIKALPRLLK